MNIRKGQDFSVIHWRAEIPYLNYQKCAEDILQARDAMTTTKKKMPFVLISSLSTDYSMMWSGTRKKADQAQNSTVSGALEFLMDNGFHMFDNTTSTLKPKDLIIYTAVDLIFAEKATSFATCSRSCDRPGFCRDCNYAGSFAEMALTNRAIVGNEEGSLSCWPSNTEEYHSMANQTTIGKRKSKTHRRRQRRRRTRRLDHYNRTLSQ
mmetsp:Transcript_23258/g.66721  ORF Transcript_23258/g.66721 Transcript_23258/m.66721 type:complete len:208 (+) Transcript_23258:2-625(+)